VEGRTSGDVGARRTGRDLLLNVALVRAAVGVTLGALEVGLLVLDVRTATSHPIAGFTVNDPEFGWKLAPCLETTRRHA